MYMAEFYDISDWKEELHVTTGGTRKKGVYVNPKSNEKYYFKTSLKKEGKDYKHEFWSEIIASELGVFLGFKMLKYDIAINNSDIGCISKSMIEESKEILREGISYLTGYKNTYNPECNKKYTFQLIKETLYHYELEDNIVNILELIVLDSILGNGDRHQENWGFIKVYNEGVKYLEKLDEDSKGFLEYFLVFLLRILSKEKNKTRSFIKDLHLKVPGKFSPIYDSGSCLGRENSDVKIDKMLSDSNMLNAYINRGKSEIHWNEKKLKHFELIEKLKVDYKEDINKIIYRVIKKYNKEKLSSIVNDIDINLPNELKQFLLPENRKKFIIEVVDKKIDKLKKMI